MKRADLLEVFPVTGDPEIDRALPRRPLLLDSVVAVPCGVDRAALLGGLFGPMLPLRVGSLETLAFMQRLDGSQTMRALLEEIPQEREMRCKLIMQLAHLGLLEEAALPQTPAANTAFCSRVFDQTRVYSCGAEAASRSGAPLEIAGDPTLQRALSVAAAGSGLTLQRADPDAAEVLLLSSAAQAIDAQHAARAAGTLVIAQRGARLHFGPLVRESGTATVSCYLRDTAHLPWGQDPAIGALQLAWCVHALLLYRARGMVFGLVNNYLEWSWSEAGPAVELQPIARRHGAAGLPLRGVDGLAGSALERLHRHSTIAVPPKSLSGNKAHEYHYAPQNLAAAGEYPRPSEAAPAPCLRQASLRTVLAMARRVFGYERVKRQVRRIAPTGGNLGSPEGLIVSRDARAGIERLWHYVPLADTLELLDTRAWSGRIAELSLGCIVNVERMTRKYGALGNNLVMLDAGVAQAFCAQAAVALGQHVTFTHLSPPQGLADEWLRPRASYYRSAWWAHFEDSGSLPITRVRSLVALRRLDARLRRRRAERALGPLPLPLRDIEGLLARSAPQLCSVLQLLRPVLCLRGGAHAGTYALQPGEDRWHLTRLCPEVALHLAPDLIMQEQLSEAGAMLLFLAPLPQLLAELGAPGHDLALLLVGRWVGQLWLELTRLGLGGCPAGATVESDVIAALPAQYAPLFQLFTFCFGSVRG